MAVLHHRDRTIIFIVVIFCKTLISFNKIQGRVRINSEKLLGLLLEKINCSNQISFLKAAFKHKESPNFQKIRWRASDISSTTIERQNSKEERKKRLGWRQGVPPKSLPKSTGKSKNRSPWMAWLLPPPLLLLLDSQILEEARFE